MNRVRLYLDKALLEGPLPEFGVLANVYPVSFTQEAKRGAGRQLRNLILPVGYGSDTLEVDLDPGRYVVEALLPSGRVVSEDLDVAADRWLANRHVERRWVAARVALLATIGRQCRVQRQRLPAKAFIGGAPACRVRSFAPLLELAGR